MSELRHIVYTYSMRTVEQKYVKRKREKKLAEKIAIMVLSLVKESVEKSKKEIEEEILKELKELIIPWVKKVEKVTVLESHED